MTTESAPFWVVVTHPDRPGLLDELAWRYRQAPWVMVLAERRRGERRRRREPSAVDLRRGDRRGVSADGGQRPVYRLVLQGDGFEVFEVSGRVSVWCPDCGGTVTFEMPRSDDPPAQLDVHVAHNLTPSTSAPSRLHVPPRGGAIGLHVENER